MINDDKYKQSNIILWFDSNPKSTHPNVEELKDYLQDTDADVVFHTEVQECINFIRTIIQKQIFLVTSGSIAAQIIPSTIQFLQINAIFILSTEILEFDHQINKYSKILGVYNDLNVLYASIREELDFVSNILLTFSSFNPRHISLEYLSKESATFLWYQLFNDVLFRLPHYEQTKTEMITMCRQYYSNNLREHTLLDYFERKYRSKEAIRWYLKSSFISKLLKKALHTQNINLLHMIQYFIGDLNNNIANEYEKILHSHESIITVYRGTKLTRKQLHKLRTSETTLISMNGYLMASRLRSLALDIAMKPTKRVDLISVLFEIECNIGELEKNTLFADITKYSDYPERQDVLFDVKVTFRLTNIEQLPEIFIIKMNASQDGSSIACDYLAERYRRTEEKSISIVFGHLISYLGHYDQAKKYFEQLLNKPDGENVAWVEFNFGRILNNRHELELAQEYYSRAYQNMIQIRPPCWKELVYMLNKFGSIFYNKGKNDIALRYYQQALKTQEKFYRFDSISNAQILNNIAFILTVQGKTKEAVDCYKRALKIYKKIQSSDPIDIARNLNNIGSILYEKGKYDKALAHYEQALKLDQNLYPKACDDVAQILNNIALILNVQEKYNQAFEFSQHAFNIQKSIYSLDHIDMAGTLNNIALILYNQAKYDDALYYHRRALTIRRKYYPCGHIDIAESLNNIGNIFYQYNKYNEALHYYLQTLDIQEKYYPPCHGDIAVCLNNIGCIHYQQEKYEEALHYHQNALKIQQKLYTNNHSDTAHTLNNIGNILCQQDQYKEALKYYRQALKIRKTIYPFGHIEIGDTLNNIAMIYKYMNRSKISLNYLQRALSQYEKILSLGHINITIIQKNIHHITEQE